MVNNIKYGQVVLFKNKEGFGFIKPLDRFGRDLGEKDIFVHFSDINSNGFRFLKPGQYVTYIIGQSKDGKIKAQNVNPAEKREV